MQLRSCALLMDIGMTDASIYPLIQEESGSGLDFMQDPEIRAAVERHPVFGSRKLEELGFGPDVIDAVRHHHEWFNGWGYPDGLIDSPFELSLEEFEA